jgi:hypothetical protein
MCIVKQLMPNAAHQTMLLSFLQAEQELGQLRGNLQDQQSMTKQEAQRVSRDSTGAMQLSARRQLLATTASAAVKALHPSQTQHSLFELHTDVKLTAETD